MTTRIGVISDTHGHLTDEIHRVFSGVDAIVHAGDIGGDAILFELEAIAPVTAVLGNTDRSYSGRHLEWSAELDVPGGRLLVVHDAHEVRSSVTSEVRVVVTGHTHRPEVMWVGDTLHVNPGSASRPRQSDGMPTVAIVEFPPDGDPRVRIVPLNG